MTNNLLDFSQFENTDSKFTAELEKRGGNITFSNSGKGGNKKYFNLSLDSFLNCLKDIKNNISEFVGHEGYVERDWRDLGSQFFNDGPANAQITVQTKPMFTTLSKIIMWANSPLLKDIDPEQYINLEISKIELAITKLDELTDKFKPVTSNESEEAQISSNSIRDFSLMVFKHFYKDNWEAVLSESQTKNSTIKGKEYIIYDHDWFKNLIGKFDKPQNKESLSSANTIRFFEEPIYIKDDKYYYFTTQWNANGEYNLSFKNLKNFIENRFPSYILLQDGKTFILTLKGNCKPKITQIKFDSESFQEACKNSGLIYKPELITRYIASLTTKPFVLLSGLSGSGKTKLAEAFAKWICESDEQYTLIPVGADWTNREPLLGYVNALDNKEYILPENGALKLLIEANNEVNKDKPYFLILDEMNLSHVERYFADFLSVMESKNEFKLHSTKTNLNSNDIEGFENAIEVPNALTWPKNLYVIGTVNIDETTYMFSPKVLDRANVIEFRVSDTDLNDYFESVIPLDMKKLLDDETKIGLGAQFGKDFVLKSNEEIDEETKKTRNKNLEKLNTELKEFFSALQDVGAEFGYRTVSEIQTLFEQIESINPNLKKIDLFSNVYPINDNFKIDVAIMQKLLPKLHGSRNKLVGVLKVLATLCYDRDLSKAFNDEQKRDIFTNTDKIEAKVIYPISLNKITRMYNNVIANGFTSYAEA
ncbi:hypothetical protein DFQ11_1011031 [Winogradskyella epiphytica]|uniref:Dynein-related subfamily AAA family protein n=1 Tax=Winogradskyella epiphytica TaxID=262005 RepID=A0A2V4YI46_9FLAO|nr:hypothetical protein [Winogradskyella epiphytica]PYE83593.1 hypothetical protein DFQ11_1011031 [Winogradskyella epiphytica]GGW59260.1 hypothetical protein GCM10008085_08850 [Winogradskyella epiphytica]